MDLLSSCEKLNALRKKMEEKNIDAVIVGTNDLSLEGGTVAYGFQRQPCFLCRYPKSIGVLDGRALHASGKARACLQGD